MECREESQTVLGVAPKSPESQSHVWWIPPLASKLQAAWIAIIHNGGSEWIGVSDPLLIDKYSFSNASKQETACWLIGQLSIARPFVEVVMDSDGHFLPIALLPVSNLAGINNLGVVARDFYGTYGLTAQIVIPNLTAPTNLQVSQVGFSGNQVGDTAMDEAVNEVILGMAKGRVRFETNNKRSGAGKRTSSELDILRLVYAAKMLRNLGVTVHAYFALLRDSEGRSTRETVEKWSKSG